jgi:two-component sensor histidine kinase/ligand-binding sensor domain-containing protein
LAIYNGNSFKLLKSNSEFELKDIENLFTDSNGLIWMATYHGIAYIKDDYLYVPENQIKDHIWRIREDDMSNIWISTQSNGVYKIGNNTIRQYFDKKYLVESFDTHLDNDNKLWIALPDGIAFVKNDSLFQYKLPTGTGSPRSYHETDNELWVGTFFGGLQKIRNDSLFYVEAETASRSVYEIMSDERGLWFSSYGYGMRLITKENMVVTLNTSEGLTNNGAIHFYIDRFSNVWVSDAQQGFSRIDDNLLFYSRENIGGGPIGDIEKYEEDVWYFYNGDYLRRIINGKRYKYTNEGSEQIPQNRHHMEGCVVGKNEAWLANYNSGVVHLKEEKVAYYRTNESDYENSAIQVEFDDSKRLWYLTRSNKLRYFKNDSIYSFDATSFEDYAFQNITFGEQTRFIYAVSDNYVLVVDGNKFKKIESQKNILAAFEDAKGVLWLFMEDGIKIYQNLKEVQYIPSKLFENTTIKAIESIKENNFLIATSMGLMELTVLNNDIKYSLHNQTKGLHLSNINLIKRIDTTVIVISGANLYYYNSLLTAKKTTPPSLIIEKVLVNSEEVSSKNIVLQQNQSIDFLFALINWGEESILEIKIDKNGKSGKWEKISKDYLSLKELSYGNYRLNVKLSNSSAGSEIHSIDFTVQPYFYQSIWFMLTLLLLASIIIFGYLRYRIRRAQKIRIELEKTIEEKTQEITAEKNEVTKQLNEKEMLLKEVNHRVKNNFQMVSSLLELQAENVVGEEAKEKLNVAISRIKSLALAHHKLYKSDNYTNINLKEYLEAIIANLTSGTDKNVELFLDDHYDVNIEKAQALGFIMNELITNSIKYAWKKSDFEKKININFVKEGSIITIKYTDNGRGFQKKITNHSLGSILISSFVSRQLMGELKTYNESGAVTLITFNEEVLI